MDQVKNKKKGGGVLFLIIVIVIVLLTLAFGVLKGAGVIKFGPSPSSKKERSNPVNVNIGNFKLGNFASRGKYVARLYITGVIQEANETYNQKWLLDTIEDLENDQNNVGILLVIDSPGGTVYEADETYLALRKYKNAGKEIWAYFKSMAASGAYYIACAADSIYANRNTMTGSIGVIIGPTIDATGLLDKLGLKATSFASGKNKGMLNYDNPLTDEQRKIMQGLVDETYEQFVSIVASARKKSYEETKVLADGRVYTAKQAKDNGLIDSIGSLENAQDRMRERLAISQNLSSDEADEVDFRDYEYIYQAPFMRRVFESTTGVSLPKAMDRTFGPDIKYPAYLFQF
ncbi:MAG: signal peptide peptidase SppA [Treponema sp.]|nr:signal peptide peptidase SppA [Treponema sp.]